MGLVVNTLKEKISKNTFWNQATALSHRTKPVDVGWGNWKSRGQVFAVTGQVTRRDLIRGGSTENCVPFKELQPEVYKSLTEEKFWTLY